MAQEALGAKHPGQLATGAGKTCNVPITPSLLAPEPVLAVLVSNPPLRFDDGQFPGKRGGLQPPLPHPPEKKQ
eukprot:6760826-Pyramimonas_sp.AAC.1